MRSTGFLVPARPARRTVVVGALLLIAAGIAPAQSPLPPREASRAGSAAPLRYTLQAGLGYSDNRERQRVAGESDLYLEGVFGFALEGETARLVWRGSGQLQASQSLQGGRDEPPRAALALALDWTLIPQRLDWHLAQLAAIEQVDPLQADTPGNRQQTRILVTGPGLQFGAPTTWLGRLDARLALARADEAPAFDHRRDSLSASLQRRSTADLTWAALAETSDVSFRDRTLSGDFRRHDLLLRGERRLAHGSLLLAYGHTRVIRERGGRLGRPLWQAELRLATPAGSQLDLRYGDALSDAGRDLSLLQDPAEQLWQEGRRARLDGALYRLRSLDYGIRRDGARWAWSLARFRREVDYVDPGIVGEARGHGLRADVAWRLSPRWTLQADVAAARYRFVGVVRADRDRGLRLGAERRLTPRWSLRLDASRFLRDSSQPGARYAENLLALFLIYRSED